jgi:Fanconi anemia group M protein
LLSKNFKNPKKKIQNKNKNQIFKLQRTLLFMELRKYQQNILAVAKEKNTLVILPTGLGKTLIAFYLIDHRLKFFGGKALFLAPTKPLVHQHYTNFTKIFSYPAAMLTGSIKSEKRKDIWEKAKVIFATPQTIANDIKNGLIALNGVSCIVFDEAHRCLKNYDYVFIAKNYKDGRILGLTASPGETKEKIDEICKNLNIEKIEIRTRESKDVKPYIKKARLSFVKVKLDEEFLLLREMINKLYSQYIEKLMEIGLLNKKNPSKRELIELNKILANEKSKNFHALINLAILLKVQHAMELLETQSIKALYLYLKDLYEKAKDKKNRATRELVRNLDFEKIFLKVLEFYNRQKEHPKLEKLREILEQKLKNNKEFKAIVFTQYRDNVLKIKEYLESFSINCQVFVGQAKKRNFGLNQKKQKEILEEFRYGLINVLISTSVGEEGLDIPEVDAVIFYEPIPSAIRKIQRAGRTARTKEGEIVILIAEKTRDEAYYWASFHKEKKMYRLIEKIDKELTKDKKTITLDKFFDI